MSAAAILGLCGLVFGLLFCSVDIIVRVIAGRVRRRPTAPVRVVDVVRGKPHFEITGGPHAGRQGMSSTSSQPPRHAVGDVATGYVGMNGYSIETENTLGTLTLLSKIFPVLGLSLGGVLLAVAAVLYVLDV